MATTPTSSISYSSLSSLLQFTCSSSSSSYSYFTEQQLLLQPMLPLMFFIFSLFSLCFLFISLYKRLRRRRREEEEEEKSTQNSLSIVERSLSLILQKTHQKTHPLFVEILTPQPPKWVSLIPCFSSNLSIQGRRNVDDDIIFHGSEGGGVDKEGNLVGEDREKSGDQRVKKKKKRAKKKKKQSSQVEDGGVEDRCLESQLPVSQEKQSFDSLYPFTSSSSVTQRKIKQQYDQLVKSHDSKGLTLAQVGQFANCLIEARNDLQQKSEIIQRKFTITKALLFKADRSAFDRISQQIYKLEAEQKRLEEDAVVYNRLQQQLKLSPAYKKMLEIGARVELEASSPKLVDSTDNEYFDISFEELLAQEKKDTFWQRNRKLRSSTN